MKYCHHCGKPVTDDVIICANCALNISKSEEELKTSPQEIINKWKNDKPINNFLHEKATTVFKVFYFVLLILGLIILVNFISNVIDISKKESTIFTRKELLHECKEFIRNIVPLALIESIIPLTMNDNISIDDYKTLSMEKYIKRENLYSQDVVHAIIKGVETKEFEKLPFLERNEIPILSRALFFFKNPTEKSKIVKNKLICWILKILTTVAFSFAFIQGLSALDYESGITVAKAIGMFFKQPMLYVAIVIFILLKIYKGKAQEYKDIEIKWLKEATSHVVVEEK